MSKSVQWGRGYVKITEFVRTYFVDGPLWNLEFTDLRKLSTLIQPQLFQFLSRFCTYLWVNSENISEVHRSSYFYGVGKKFLRHMLLSCNHWMCGKIKTTVFFLVIILFKHYCLYFIVLTLMCFQFTMPSGNCAIYGCSSSRTTPGVSQHMSNTRGTTFL